MNANADVRAGVRKYLIKGLVAKLVMALILFLSAGRLDWVMGWLLFGVYVTWDTVVALLLIPRSPGLIAERAAIQKGSKTWDIVLTTLAASLLPLTTWLVAGLDVRFGWTAALPPALQIAALVVVVLGFALVTWAMASNEFFSTIVRIQDDRDHSVATGGPYRVVRHPGYVAAMMFGTATPLMLGSLWALIPAGLSALLYVVRTALEDKTLQDELGGYRQYAQRVRYRLLPGVW
ncbi:MAG: isoprenylcysteine carboxylmethyltransferase family protein [Chloroflexi bacterium]|nr:isoprenylcysteine carboxylmethyltransferase family protein [Chloroflexota bacterium]